MANISGVPNTPPNAVSRRRLRRRRPRNLRHARLSLLIALIIAIAPAVLVVLPTATTVDAREIVATSEWTKLEPGDTVPAGLHVRIDMSTGERWAKLNDDDDDENAGAEAEKEGAAGGGKVVDGGGPGSATTVNEAVVGPDGSVTAGSGGAVAVAPSSSGADGDGGDGARDAASAAAAATTAQQSAGSGGKIQKDDGEDEGSGAATGSSAYDYDMMYRTLSKLPEDEIERMGGLPALPGGTNDVSGRKKVSPEERKMFEERMAEIWRKRQEEIHSMQEEFMADLPKMLLERIRFVGGYLEDPAGQRAELLEERKRRLVDARSDDARNDDDDDDDDEAAALVVSNIVAVLEDVEYHVADVDHARDFHTLGGWPTLISLLSDEVHSLQHPSSSSGTRDDNATIVDEDRDLVDEIQAAAAWVVGTAVKNHEEFRSWALEDISMAFSPPPDRPVTVVSLLLSNLRDLAASGSARPASTAASRSKRQRCLYALGSLLRGNPSAQRHFLDLDGPSILGSDLSRLLLLLGGEEAGGGGTRDAPSAAADVKFASKVLALGDDLVTDILLHGGNDDTDGGNGDDGGRLIRSLTTEPWCRAALDLARSSGVTSVPIRERALNAVRTMVPYCGFGVEGRRVVESVGAELRGGRRGDAPSPFMELDPAYRAELIALVDSVLSEMGGVKK